MGKQDKSRARDNTKPSVAQLRELYEAAAEFKRMRPWQGLYDTDIICVEDPETKEMGYCSIMGKGGEHFALGIYVGAKGLFHFNQLFDDMSHVPEHQLLHYNDCLMCSFEDRNVLSTEERKQIKDLGLSFRGKNAWPMFRLYEPGFFPWYPNAAECVFLTHALRQTLVMVAALDNGEMTIDLEHGKTIGRFAEQSRDGLIWHSREFDLREPDLWYNSVEVTDETLIRRLKTTSRGKAKASLQVDVLYTPFPVQEDKRERPYYPRVLLIADKASGQILANQIYPSKSEDADFALRYLADICLKYGVPKEVQVRSEALVAYLGDFCAKVGIKLKPVKRLDSVDEVMEYMALSFRDR